MSVRLTNARDLMRAKPEDVLRYFRGPFKLAFEDGEVAETTGVHIAINRFAWEMLARYPKVKITSRYHIRNYMKYDEGFTSGGFLKMMSDIMHDIFDHYDSGGNEATWGLQKDVWGNLMSINNRLFNATMIDMQRYRVTTNMEDILEIMLDDEILKIKKDHPVNRDTVRDSGFVGQIYKKQMNVIMLDRMRENNLALLLKCKGVKEQQVNQCIGPRGVVNDINQDVIREPIASGYFQGFSRNFDLLAESRTAAMSLNNQSAPLQYTEYFSRKMQFLGKQLHNLHHVDCGSQHYLEVQIRAEHHGLTMSDLEYYEGNYYLDEETGKLKVIKRQDKHLIGQRLKLRHVFGCQHEDHNGVCAVCFGQTARSVPKYRNLGHFCITSFTQQVSQRVLSTKHHVASVAIAGVELMESYRDILVEMNDRLSVGINANIKKTYDSIKLIVHEDAIEGLKDIIGAPDVTTLSPRRTSNITRVAMKLVSRNGNVREEIIDVIPENDEGNLSMAMLMHMKKHGWERSDDGFIAIEMAAFDMSLPVIDVTPKEHDMFAFAKHIESIVKSRSTGMTPESFLVTLSDTVNSKVPINFSIVQVMAYVIMAVDDEHHDYSLPKPHTTRSVSNMDNLIYGRSLSASYSYERQNRTIASPESFYYTNRPDSPMDEFFVPNELYRAGKLEYYH